MNLYPETNLNQSNLGWIIAEIQKLQAAVNAIIATGTGGDIEIVYRAEDMTDITKLYLYMASSVPPYPYLYGHVYRWSSLMNQWTDLGVMIINYPIPVADGGTNADNPADARINLGITPAAIGAVDTDDIIDVAHGGTGADNATDAKTNLGITLANLGGEPAITSNNPLVLEKGGTGATTQAGARSALGLGTAAVLSDPITVSHGGTGANSKATARTNLSALGSNDITYEQHDGEETEVPANTYASLTVTMTKPGYTLVGIGAVWGVGDGYFELHGYYFSGNTLTVEYKNTDSTARKITARARGIYVKNV